MPNSFIESAKKAKIIRELKTEALPPNSWQREMHAQGWQFYEHLPQPNNRLSDVSKPEAQTEAEESMPKGAQVIQMPRQVLAEQIEVVQSQIA